MDDPQRVMTEDNIGPNKVALAKLAVAAILAALFVVFAAQNSGNVEVEFLSWGFQMRVILLMVLSAVVGVLVWELAGFLRRRRNG